MTHSVDCKSGTMFVQSKMIPPPSSGGQMVQLLHFSFSFPITGTQEFLLMRKGLRFFFSKKDDDVDGSVSAFDAGAVIPKISPNKFANGSDQQTLQGTLG